MCRNVFIYFDAPTIHTIINKLKKYIHKDSYFITGLSESLKAIDIEKQTLAPSVYCFDKPIILDNLDKNIKDEKNIESTLHPAPQVSLIPKPIKILTVDDSPSVLKLLGKVFESDHDFKVVGTAKNGIEAQDFIKNNEVDAMTLDIHMPKMDGVEYLKKNFKKGHPHVIVVSSASREDTRYAQVTLQNGACDFVEKPALNNLNERAEEIKNKIKMAFLMETRTITSIDKSFGHDFIIKNLGTKTRIFFSNFSDIEKVRTTLKDLKGEQPPTIVFFEGNHNYLEIIMEKLNDIKNLNVYNPEDSIINNHIYICDFKEHFEYINKQITLRRKSISIFGICSKNVLNAIIHADNMQLLLEDIKDINKDLKEIATDIFPWTSFSHVGTEYLSKE